MMIPFLCPNCKNSSLIEVNNLIICEDTICNSKFKLINNKPVLINFSQSLIDEKKIFSSNGRSIVKRKSLFVFKWLRLLLYGRSLKTKNNLKFCISKCINFKKPMVLVVGGGTIGSGTEVLYSNSNIILHSFDVYFSNNISFIADAHDIPLKSNTYDLVIIQAVLEHVLNPNKVVAECYRVLKEGSYIYAETPFMQQVHEGPYDFLRFSNSGHRYLFKDFECVKTGYIGGLSMSLIWAMSYFLSGVFRSIIIGKISRVLFFWLRFIDLIIPNKFQMDGASGYFFIGKKTPNTSLNNPEIIQFYNGAQ